MLIDPVRTLRFLITIRFWGVFSSICLSCVCDPWSDLTKPLASHSASYSGDNSLFPNSTATRVAAIAPPKRHVLLPAEWDRQRALRPRLSTVYLLSIPVKSNSDNHGLVTLSEYIAQSPRLHLPHHWKEL